MPAGDRTLADFFAIGYNPANGRLSVVFDRDNKKPDEAAGHIATPMVVTQIAGPSNNGGTVSVDGTRRRPRRRRTTRPATRSRATRSPRPPSSRPTRRRRTRRRPTSRRRRSGPTPRPAASPSRSSVADLSTAALTQALADTGGQSLLWVWRFANGYQDAAASARWNPVSGFTFGYNGYATGGTPCAGVTNAQGEKCVVYPGTQPVAGRVDQAAGDDHAHRPGDRPAAALRGRRERPPARAACCEGVAPLRRHGVLVRKHDRRDAGHAVLPLHAGLHACDGLPAAVRVTRPGETGGRRLRPASRRPIRQPPSGKARRLDQRSVASSSSISTTSRARAAIGSST